jgi:hypothetical protein
MTNINWVVKYSIARATGFYLLKRRFQRKLGYWPDFHNPQTFNERTQHKKLFDRNPLLPIVSDKYQVRKYIIDTLGEEGKEYLIPLLAVAKYPEDIDFKNLPDEYIIKANHGGGTNLIVRKDSSLNQEEIIKRCYKWLFRAYGLSSFQWAYTRIKKRIIVEELLTSESGGIPEDYKFHIINGKCQFIQVDYERHGQTHSRTHYDTDWNQLPFTSRHASKTVTESPTRLVEMIERSIQLAKPFEYTRVDWYVIGDRIFLGELTQYPGNGTMPFLPASYDKKTGQLWENNLNVHDIL